MARSLRSVRGTPAYTRGSSTFCQADMEGEQVELLEDEADAPVAHLSQAASLMPLTFSPARW